MSLLKNLLAVSMIAFLSGCASGVAFTDMNPSAQPVDPEQGRIYFYRPSVLGAAVKPKIKLNNVEIAVSTARGFTFVDRSAGDYVVETSTEVDRRLSFVLQAGETRYVRQSINMGFLVGHVYPELVEAAEALEDLKCCKWVEPLAP